MSLRRIHVITDGDSWPVGCCDFHFDFEFNSYEKYTSALCEDDGASFAVPNNHMGYAPGEFTEHDYKGDAVEIAFLAQDDDPCPHRLVSLVGAGSPRRLFTQPSSIRTLL
jgi:hypothetical protein